MFSGLRPVFGLPAPSSFLDLGTVEFVVLNLLIILEKANSRGTSNGETSNCRLNSRLIVFTDGQAPYLRMIHLCSSIEKGDGKGMMMSEVQIAKLIHYKLPENLSLRMSINL